MKFELPKDYQKHSEIYLDYKSQNTFKGLVCISPGGWITFVSQLHHGRICDEITEKSNFCQLIDPGDQYLGDEGLEINDLIALKSFSAADQFPEGQCIKTRSISNVQIHVERAIKQENLLWHIVNSSVKGSNF